MPFPSLPRTMPGRFRWPREVSGLAMLLLGGCQSGVLDPKGPIGTAERLILLDSLAIMLSIVLPVIVLTLAFAWWFRASNTRAQHRPEWAYSGRLELLVWSIPIIVILFLGGVTWAGSHDLDPRKPIAAASQAVTIQVVSLDWKWLFIYPGQGVASINQLIIPAGVPVNFELTSATVMNSFFIPQLGSQIYTMSGMTTHVSLQADQPGLFSGLSAQFSGDGFSAMHFEVSAVSKSAFDEWVARTREGPETLDHAAYGKLAKARATMPPVTFRAVDANLFHDIVGNDMARGEMSGAQPTPPRVTPR